jgi:hypothetical protein
MSGAAEHARGDNLVIKSSGYRPGTGIVQRIIQGVPVISPSLCARFYGSIIPEKKKKKTENRVKTNGSS